MIRMNNYLEARTFTELRRKLIRQYEHSSHEVKTERWQGVDIMRRPEMASTELMNVSYTIDLMAIHDLHFWCQDVRPHLPWADDHFAERVCGYPINPGVEWANWPWGDSAKKFIEEGGMFNHNYMERYWPKHAHDGAPPSRTAEEWVNNENEMAAGRPWLHNEGIRHVWGDLGDLVNLLAKEPLTRQGWIPIFFPEDTGYGDGGRKPCTLGYQFMVRDGRLHCYYPLRSCDFIRHWCDDIYLTIRLMLWIIEECSKIDPVWERVQLGSLSMHMTSLHVFKNDLPKLQEGL